MAGGPYNPNQMGGPPMGGPMNPNPMNPMGGPPMGQPMGQPPMQQQQRPPVMRQGTSRVVPVVVSAGLAIGVFCGLLFGVGTGGDVVAAPSTGTNAKKLVEDTTPTPSMTPTPTLTASSLPAKKPDAAAGSAAGSAMPAPTPTLAAGSGAKADPAIHGAKLTIGLKPDNLVKTATITVDGKEMTDGAMEVVFDTGATKKEVKVVVKASGYKDVEKMVEVDADTRVEIELIKGGKSTPVAATGTGTTGTTAVTGTGTTGTTVGVKTTGTTGTGTTGTSGTTGTKAAGTGTVKSTGTGTKSTGTGTKSTGGGAKKPPGGVIDI